MKVVTTVLSVMATVLYNGFAQHIHQFIAFELDIDNTYNQVIEMQEKIYSNIKGCPPLSIDELIVNSKVKRSSLAYKLAEQEYKETELLSLSGNKAGVLPTSDSLKATFLKLHKEHKSSQFFQFARRTGIDDSMSWQQIIENAQGNNNQNSSLVFFSKYSGNRSLEILQKMGILDKSRDFQHTDNAQVVKDDYKPVETEQPA